MTQKPPVDVIQTLIETISNSPHKTIGDAKAEMGSVPEYENGLLHIILKYLATSDHLSGDDAVETLRRWQLEILQPIPAKAAPSFEERWSAISTAYAAKWNFIPTIRYYHRAGGSWEIWANDMLVVENVSLTAAIDTLEKKLQRR